MIGTFKDFYKFVKCFNPKLCNVWEDFHNRPDPKEGDVYMYGDEKIIFDNIIFDSKFKNGVAFFYNFHKENGDTVVVYSINDVYEPDKLLREELNDLYSFWTKCFPY